MRLLYMLALGLLVFARIAEADYSFTLNCRSDTLQAVQPGGVAYFYFTLTNTGTEPDVYEFDCRVIQEVPGWSAIYCLRGRCVEPGMVMFDTLAPGESDTTIDIGVFTASNPGEEVVRLTVTSVGNPALSAGYNTRTRVGGGVEEAGGNGVFLLSGEVFDRTGRRVFSISRPGVYFIRRSGTGGFHKVLFLK